jgi:hypothetical protein
MIPLKNHAYEFLSVFVLAKKEKMIKILLNMYTT